MFFDEKHHYREYCNIKSWKVMKREDITPDLIENVVGFFDSLPKPDYTVSITIAKYTRKDELLDIHTGTFKEIFDSVRLDAVYHPKEQICRKT